MPVSAKKNPGISLRAIADDDHAERLESLDRRVQIEDRLRAGADDDDWRAGELGEIGRFIELRLAMHAADSAGREHADRRQRHQRQRSRDGRRTVAPVRASRPECRARSLSSRRRARGIARARRRRDRTSLFPRLTAAIAGTAPARSTAVDHSSCGFGVRGNRQPRARTELSSATTGSSLGDARSATRAENEIADEMWDREPGTED